MLLIQISTYYVYNTVFLRKLSLKYSVYFIKTVIPVYSRALGSARHCSSRGSSSQLMPSPVKTAVSCPPSLLSQGHRYLWGMSSIQVTVPIVFWGRRPPSHGLTTGLAWPLGAGLARYVYGTCTRGTLLERQW